MARTTVKRAVVAPDDGAQRPKRACSSRAKQEATTEAYTVSSCVETEAISVSAVENLDPVYGGPPAWAETRSDLCDALPWFRCTQGGLYHYGGFCWGLLMDADCGIRAYIDDEVVITRIGGGCTKDADGNLILIKNQDEDNASVSSLVHSKVLRVPVGLILGDRNPLLGRRLPHRYNVMAFFRITDIWFERIGSKVGAKVRFEKLDLTEKSWWAAKDSPMSLPAAQRDFALQPQTMKCQECMSTSPRVYDEGWMCLAPSCKDFWVIDGRSPPSALTFHSDFLAYRSRPDPNLTPHHSLVPDLLATITDKDADASTSRICWKGIICPQCRKCISRRFWRGWKCTDDIEASPESNLIRCPFEKMVEMRLISLRSVVDDFELAPIKRALFFDPKFALPNIDDETCLPYRKLTYNIAGVGSITHFVANKSINARANGPNDLFERLQVADLGLRRYPLQRSVVAGTLTAHFAVNYGMPYKYVVSVDSKGFDQAPGDILRALGRLSWASEKAVTEAGDKYMPPNELLLLGYFEDMKIGYHDDGESSLGPTIATLSLGAKSTMHIRMKYKYYHGYSKAKRLLDDDPALDGCKVQAKRLQLKQSLADQRLTRETYDEARRELLQRGRNGEAPPIIKMELHHGDLVVMHGEKLQKYFEHSVIPEKKLRFALTARYIQPDHVDIKDRDKGDFILTPDQIYDGK